MTVAQFIANEVRRQIRDDVPLTVNGSPVYRWEDADLLAVINTKRRTLYAEHPEAFYVTAIVTACPDDLATVGLILDVAQEYVEALREYVVKTVQTEDGDDSANLPLVKIHDQNAEGLVE